MKRLPPGSQRDQLSRLTRSTGCNHDVLLTVHRVSHGHARLALPQIDLGQDLSCALVALNSDPPHFEPYMPAPSPEKSNVLVTNRADRSSLPVSDSSTPVSFG